VRGCYYFCCVRDSAGKLTLDNRRFDHGLLSRTAHVLLGWLQVHVFILLFKDSVHRATQCQCAPTSTRQLSYLRAMSNCTTGESAGARSSQSALHPSNLIGGLVGISLHHQAQPRSLVASQSVFGFCGFDTDRGHVWFSTECRY